MVDHEKRLVRLPGELRQHEHNSLHIGAVLVDRVTAGQGVHHDQAHLRPLRDRLDRRLVFSIIQIHGSERIVGKRGDDVLQRETPPSRAVEVQFQRLLCFDP